MRKLLFATLALIALTLGTASAQATHSAGVGPRTSFVAGTGEISFLGLEDVSSSRIHVSANSTAGVDGTFGTFFAEVTGLGQEARFRGAVTCLHIAGSEARVGGVVTTSSSPLVPLGTETVARFIDNGDSNRNDPPDLAVGQVGLPAASCPLYMQPPETVRDGGYVVHSP